MIYLQGKQNRIWSWDEEDLVCFLLNFLTGLADRPALCLLKAIFEICNVYFLKDQSVLEHCSNPIVYISVYGRKLYLWSILT